MAHLMDAWMENKLALLKVNSKEVLKGHHLVSDEDYTVFGAESKGSDTHQIVFTILTGTCQGTW